MQVVWVKPVKFKVVFVNIVWDVVKYGTCKFPLSWFALEYAYDKKVSKLAYFNWYFGPKCRGDDSLEQIKQYDFWAIQQNLQASKVEGVHQGECRDT